MIDDDSWMSISDAAEAEGVVERTIRRRIERGEYPAKTVAGKRYVRLVDSVDSDVSQVSRPVSQDVVMEKLEADKEWLQKRVEDLEGQLKRKDEQMEEARSRSDTIILQLSQTQTLLEDKRQSFWRRWMRRRTEEG